MPALLLAPAPLAAKQWQKVYSIGVQVAPALAVVGTLATGYLAYHRKQPYLLRCRSRLCTC